MSKWVRAHVERYANRPGYGTWLADENGLPPEQVILNHWHLGTDQETHDIAAPFPVRKGDGYPINLETMQVRTDDYREQWVGLEMEITPAYYLLEDELSGGTFDPRRLDGVRHVARTIGLLHEMHGIGVDLLYGFNWWRGIDDPRRLVSDAAVSAMLGRQPDGASRSPAWGFPLYGGANPADGWRWYRRIAAGVARAEELHDATGQTIALFVTPIGYTSQQFVMQCEAAVTMAEELAFVEGVVVWAVGPATIDGVHHSYSSTAHWRMRAGLAVLRERLGPLPAMAEAVLDEGGEG